MFSHQFIDDFTIALGYGNGLIQFMDIRTQQPIGSLKDSHISMVGDIFVNSIYDTHSQVLVSGIGGFSWWDIEIEYMEGSTLELIEAETIASSRSVPMIDNNEYG